MELIEKKKFNNFKKLQNKHILLTTRFNNDTWNINENYRIQQSIKCVYCSPESSSRWQDEVRQHGEIKQTEYNLHNLDWLKSAGKLPIHHKVNWRVSTYLECSFS